MAKMPSSVTVGRTTYTVVNTAAEWHELSQGDLGVRANDHGATNHHRLLMGINPSDHAQQQADTLLHEILHAVWFVGCLDNALAGEDPKEERIIGQLTPWLMLALTANPEAVAFMNDPEV